MWGTPGLLADECQIVFTQHMVSSLTESRSAKHKKPLNYVTSMQERKIGTM